MTGFVKFSVAILLAIFTLCPAFLATFEAFLLYVLIFLVFSSSASLFCQLDSHYIQFFYCFWLSPIYSKYEVF